MIFDKRKVCMMKHYVKFFLLLIISMQPVATFAVCSSLCPDVCNSECICAGSCCCTNVRSIYVPRSQSRNTARQFQLYGHQYRDDCSVYGGLSALFAYTKSFNDSTIARCLFGSSTLRFSGSAVVGRNPNNELLADNFGLAPDFTCALTVRPRIDNFMVDINYYLGLDRWFHGLYFAFHAPLVHSRWQLQACTNCPENSTPPQFPACDMGADIVPATRNLALALGGQFDFGDKQEDWSAGKFNFCKQATTRVADIDLILGYDFLQCDWYHVGVYFLTVAPTGNRPDDEFFFSPIVGNGKHWEIGAGISAHVGLWDSENHSLTIYCDGNLTHPLKSRQKRSFDFCNNGPFSRYMLLKELTVGTNGEFVYAGNLVNAINFATRTSDVSIAACGDASIRLLYSYKNIDWGIGYNIYGRSEEKIAIRCCDILDIDKRMFGIKGCEPVASLCIPTQIIGGIEVASAAGTPTDLNATAHNATAFSCGTIDNPGAASIGATITTPGQICYTCDTTIPAIVPGITPITALPAANAQRSNPPIIVSCCDLNQKSAASPAQLSNKIFGHINYTWSEHCYEPYITLGAEGEFAAPAHRCTLSQWGFWCGGGISF